MSTSASLRLANLFHQALERVVGRDAASAVLFDALGEAELPETSWGEMLAFIDGPLRVALGRNVGSHDLDELLDLVRPPMEHAMRRLSEETDEMPTKRVKTISSRPTALVFDDGSGLGRRMMMAFPADRLMIDVVRDVGETRLKHVSFVIVDATTMSASAPVAVAKGCASLPADTLRVVHGVETTYGARLYEAFRATSQDVIAVRKDHGAAPLVELIRARMSAIDA